MNIANGSGHSWTQRCAHTHMGNSPPNERDTKNYGTRKTRRRLPPQKNKNLSRRARRTQRPDNRILASGVLRKSHRRLLSPVIELVFRTLTNSSASSVALTIVICAGCEGFQRAVIGNKRNSTGVEGTRRTRNTRRNHGEKMVKCKNPIASSCRVFRVLRVPSFFVFLSLGCGRSPRRVLRVPRFFVFLFIFLALGCG